MSTNISEIPERPLPHVPPSPEPQRPYAQPPTVFVYEKERWEYKVVSRDTAGAPPLTEDELNALGKDGWEMVGVVPVAGGVQFIFKRPRS